VAGVAAGLGSVAADTAAIQRNLIARRCAASGGAKLRGRALLLLHELGALAGPAMEQALRRALRHHGHAEPIVAGVRLLIADLVPIAKVLGLAGEAVRAAADRLLAGAEGQ